MKRITLIRHAKSSWDDSSRSDFERPLNKRGEKDAPRIGRELARTLLDRGGVPRPDRLVSSPAVRALSTARIIAREIGCPEDEIVEEPRIYEASASALLRLIREFDDSLGHVMLFGHNPGLETLARNLDPEFRGDGHKFPTCGVFLTELRTDHWSEVAANSAAGGIFLCPRSIGP